MLGFWSYMENFCLGGFAGWRKLGTYWRLMFRGKHFLPFSLGGIACFMLSCEHPMVFCTSVNSCSHLRTWHSAKVARLLAAKPMDLDMEQDKSCTVMALLDGGTLKRHRSWLKAEPPAMVVATIGSSCQMLERQVFKLDTVQILVIDEVDFVFNSSKQVSSLRKLLTSYSSSNNRQTVFASVSIPQHKRFLHDCIQQKWTKGDVVNVHVNPIQPMPSCLDHTFVTCHRSRRHQTLPHLLQWDSPESGIIFVGEQEVRQNEGYFFVATDIAARGNDLPETTHIYNFDLPKSAIDYLHRAGRTGRNPFSDKKCVVTSIIASEERFVLKRYENELILLVVTLILILALFWTVCFFFFSFQPHVLYRKPMVTDIKF